MLKIFNIKQIANPSTQVGFLRLARVWEDHEGFAVFAIRFAAPKVKEIQNEPIR
jgi:hypothetical protein